MRSVAEFFARLLRHQFCSRRGVPPRGIFGAIRTRILQGEYGMKSCATLKGGVSRSRRDFLHDVRAGLRSLEKELPCKYFYDKRGSELFDRICQLDEYYLTRSELSIMEKMKR